jgi:hypothetical protein
MRANLKAELKTAPPNLRVLRPGAIPHLHRNGEMGAVLDFWLTDTKTGLMIPGSREVRKAESYVSNYLKILYAQMKQLSTSNPLGPPSYLTGITLPSSIPSPENYDTATNTHWFVGIVTATANGIVTHIVITGGNGGNIGSDYNVASIRAVSGGLPTGPDLAVYTEGNHDWWGNGVFVGPPFAVTNGTQYAICVRRNNSSNEFHFDYAAGTGVSASSTDSGSTWTAGTRNYYFNLYGIQAGDEAGAVDTGGAYRCLLAMCNGDWSSPSIAFDVLAGSSVTTFGIRAGTGTTPQTISDYAIQTPIAEGSGAGQLNHGAVTFGNPAADTSTSQFTITRNLANNSGGSITVSELGLYCRCYSYDGGDLGASFSFLANASRQTRYFMIIHDVLSTPKMIPTGQTLTANYRPQASI